MKSIGQLSKTGVFYDVSFRSVINYLTIKHNNMKRILLITVLTSVMAILSISCFAQNKLSWVPEKGHWMLVSNIHNKKTITVQFYNEDNALIYEETLNNVRLNPNRKKVR